MPLGAFTGGLLGAFLGAVWIALSPLGTLREPPVPSDNGPDTA